MKRERELVFLISKLHGALEAVDSEIALDGQLQELVQEALDAVPADCKGLRDGRDV